MEDKKINEMESIELIAEMIRKTKKEASMKQDYNAFLLYGYAAVLISIVAWVGIQLTGQQLFMTVWFAMFLPYIWTLIHSNRRKQEVTTYLGEMLGHIWKIIGSMFVLTIFVILAVGLGVGRIDFSLMMPLSLIYAGIGTSMTGLVIKEKWFVWTPLVGLLTAVFMLVEGSCTNMWNLFFGFSFLIFMIIPAHIVRSKIQ